jgi:hypothetical protein
MIPRDSAQVSTKFHGTGTQAMRLCPNFSQLSFPAEDVGVFDRASRIIVSETRGSTGSPP